uniref:F5/8 type C domain-containing protein n=1 Tax=Macrostomum lignano TaxID=282301 RepID=A0A1I8JPK7_9PLAT
MPYGNRPGGPLHCGRGLSQTYLADKLNPRTSGDLTVLLNMPHNRVYCSALAANLGRAPHHLELNQPQPFNGSAHPDAASRPSWRVVDVTEVSRIAEFDFLMDESHGLTKDTEYFVALSGCSSTQCRTAGFAKFTAWQQGGGKQNLVVIIAGSGAAVAVAACVIAVGVTLGIRFRDSNAYEQPSPVEMT